MNIKLEAEQAYLNAKKTIEEIKAIQINIKKLLDDLRELAVVFVPKKEEKK